MEKYDLIKAVGAGTYGRVFQAYNRQSGELVAIKQLKKKFTSWEQCKNLVEVNSLRKLNNHRNIVKLKEIILQNNSFFLVFEYMQGSLDRLIEQRETPFSESQVRDWCFQVLRGLHYMHESGYFHRDLKPGNLLVSGNVIKIADLGMVREINSQPPYTEYVTTRWYRAPEVMLKTFVYSSKVDMWAMGAIIAEMMTLRPLFPGTSEADQMYRICCVLGSPTKESWGDGLRLAGALNFQFPELPGVNLSRLIPSASYDAISLIAWLCSWDPYDRPTAAEALQHPFFRSCVQVPRSLHYNAAARTTPGFVAATGRVLEVDEVSDVAEMNISNRQSLRQLNPPSMMRTGLGWDAKSEDLLRRLTHTLACTSFNKLM